MSTEVEGHMPDDDVVAAVIEAVAVVAWPEAPTITDDGAIAFSYKDLPTSVRVARLLDSLDVVSLTVVLGFDLVTNKRLRQRVRAAAEAVQFGSVHLVERGRESDVWLRYSFPASGLEQTALTAMLMLVLDGAFDATVRL